VIVIITKTKHGASYSFTKPYILNSSYGSNQTPTNLEAMIKECITSQKEPNNSFAEKIDRMGVLFDKAETIANDVLSPF